MDPKCNEVGLRHRHTEVKAQMEEEGSLMMTEAEHGVTLPQAKECLEHQKLEEAGKDFLLEPLNKCGPMGTLISNFCPLEL